MRIAVTGATGFIGHAFVHHALASGHRIWALVRPGRDAPAAHAALAVGRGTLADPPWDELAGFAPDACVHTAWTTVAGVYLESPENDRYRQESVAFATGLFERGIGHLVALGTCAEYRPSPQPLDEAAPLEPRSPYARAKHALHRELADRASAAGTRVAWARVFQLYGAGEPSARLCSTVVRHLVAGRPVTLDSPDAVRDWIHVDDVAAALLHLVESGTAGVVNVGTGLGRTVHSMALAVAGLLGRPDLVAAGAASREVEGPRIADPARLRALGWCPRVALESGLAALIERLR
jgi:dTDP-6-deoxy-L-talose 4-dehydrogenase (NAD+)